MNIKNIVNTLPRNPRKRPPTRLHTEIRSIAMHHSLGPIDQSPREIANYHVHGPGHGWPCIGYAYLVYHDGQIYKTANLTEVTYHVGDANRSALGICMVGNFDVARPTDAQWNAAINLCVTLVSALPNVTTNRILAHYEYPGYSTKSCPGTRINASTFRRAVKKSQLAKMTALNTGPEYNQTLAEVACGVAFVSVGSMLRAWIDRVADRLPRGTHASDV